MTKTQALKNLDWYRYTVYNFGEYTYGWKCIYNGNWVGSGKTKTEALKQARLNVGRYL